jgi:hypothetical protein
LTLARPAGASVPGLLTDALVPAENLSAEEALDPNKASYAEYTVNLPRAGRWQVWGRVWYEDTNSNSFFFTGGGHQHAVFGNLIGTYHTWLWEGGLAFDLEAGPFTFRIEGREGKAKVSPLLDVLCLVRNDPAYVPTDADARAALRRPGTDAVLFPLECGGLCRRAGRERTLCCFLWSAAVSAAAPAGNGTVSVPYRLWLDKKPTLRYNIR